MIMTMDELSNACMEMICNAGEGRSKVYEALNDVLKEDYASADAKLLEAQDLLAEAHRVQFEQLMAPQLNGTEIPFSLLLLHAMDISLVSTSEHDLLRAVVSARLNKDA